MDYSKQGGGTRVLDQAKARELATGMGQTINSNLETGSARMARVCEGIKPGALVSDPALRMLHDHKEGKREEREAYAMANDEYDCAIDSTCGPETFPICSGACSHEDANGMFADKSVDAKPSKQIVPKRPAPGEKERQRVPTTSRGRRDLAAVQTSLRLAQK